MQAETEVTQVLSRTREILALLKGLGIPENQIKQEYLDTIDSWP